MSWGTLLNVDIEVLRETFHTIYELESKIEETNDNINSIQSKILMYCSSTPKDIILPEEDVNVLDKIKHEVDELFQWYNDELVLRFKLNLIKDNFDKRINY